MIDVLRYMREFGLPDEGCMPYSGEGLGCPVFWEGGTFPASATPPPGADLLPRRPWASGLALYRVCQATIPPNKIATDHTKYGKHARRCPASGYCTNCMPIDGKDTCWPVRRPLRYGLAGYGQINVGGPHGAAAQAPTGAGSREAAGRGLCNCGTSLRPLVALFHTQSWTSCLTKTLEGGRFAPPFPTAGHWPQRGAGHAQ